MGKLQIYLPIASLIVAILGLLWTYFGAILNIKERIVALETKMELFWKPLQDFLTTAIHHPVTPTIDSKLEKFDDLAMEELYELRAEIKTTMDTIEDRKDIKLLYYTLLMSRIDSRLVDKKVEACRPKGGFFGKVAMLFK